MNQSFDIIIVGGGMAGASLAAELSSSGRVALVEAEQHAGYHTTGRSAALFSELYGNCVVRGLTRASREFFYSPPAGFAANPLVSPRRTMYFAARAHASALGQFRADADIASGTIELDAVQAHVLVPAFRPDYLAGAALETGSADIDVDAVHQGFLRQSRAAGAGVMLGAPATAIERRAGLWHVETPAGRLSAPVIVNAAGAWGDAVATMAGVDRLGLLPLRRTAVLIDPPDDMSAAWPAAIDLAGDFYFKPDAGLLLLSPADEHPSEPCDAQPEELDVAIAIDRFEQATGSTVRRVKHRWAGLRVFSSDRTPVVGFDHRLGGFFWFVGQGGYGIQAAPALARLAAALVRGEDVPADIAAQGVDAQALSPGRFAKTDENRSSTP